MEIRYALTKKNHQIYPIAFIFFAPKVISVISKKSQYRDFVVPYVVERAGIRRIKRKIVQNTQKYCQKSSPLENNPMWYHIIYQISLREGAMNNINGDKTCRGLLLRRNKVDFSGGVLVYELRAVKTEDGVLMSVTVKLGTESSSCLFAARIVEVLKFYNAAVRNTVTPCTLGDVAEDFKNQFILDGAN